ncbi:MAG: twin-arginine translocase TatA/TatE family subunit [Deltaproteobacteria bacterium]|nr:MAG: twin-arginine translocase TatA/TatE family subunit [Deltaproteobacteria bacterium]
MFGLGTQELIIILVIVLVIFGAGKLPQVGGALGKGIRNFKKGMNDDGDEPEELKRIDENEKKDDDKSDQA